MHTAQLYSCIRVLRCFFASWIILTQPNSVVAIYLKENVLHWNSCKFVSLLCLFQSWPSASGRRHSRSPHPTSPPDPPSRYSLLMQVIFWEMIKTLRLCGVVTEPVKHALKHLPSSFQLKINLLFHLLFQSTDTIEFHCVFAVCQSQQSPIKAWKASELGQCRKDGVWEKEGEEGRAVFIKHRVGSQSHLSL